jgi:hypothetical protein
VISSLNYRFFLSDLCLIFFLYAQHEALKSPARVLHMHFQPRWSYYDICDSFRKLLLTSVVLFVADPRSPSRALFLLSVDAVALVVLAATRPYRFRADDILSFSLVLMEFLVFLMVLLMLSDAAAIANYSLDGMLMATFVCILSAFFVFVPMTWMLKLQDAQVQQDTGSAAGNRNNSNSNSNSNSNMPRKLLQQRLSAVELPDRKSAVAMVDNPIILSQDQL